MFRDNFFETDKYHESNHGSILFGETKEIMRSKFYEGVHDVDEVPKALAALELEAQKKTQASKLQELYNDEKDQIEVSSTNYSRQVQAPIQMKLDDTSIKIDTIKVSKENKCTDRMDVVNTELASKSASISVQQGNEEISHRLEKINKVSSSNNPIHEIDKSEKMEKTENSELKQIDKELVIQKGK